MKAWWGRQRQKRKTIVFTEVPADYIQVNSGLGNITPPQYNYHPDDPGWRREGCHRDRVGPCIFTVWRWTLLRMVMESLAIIFSAAQSRTRMKELLEETQRQAEELQSPAGRAETIQRRAPGGKRCCLKNLKQSSRHSRKNCSRQMKSWRRKQTCLETQKEKALNRRENGY
ncbi:MAG: hypothetical protein WDN75_06390 [Bacteroidota bacterium]